MKFLKNLLGDWDPITTDQLKVITDSVNNVVTAVFGFLSLGAVILAIMLAYKFFTATDETKRKNAKMQLIYAIIAIIVLIIMTIIIPQVVSELTKAAKGEQMFQLVF